MKIGILLPTSKLYPSIIVDFNAGVRMALAQFGRMNDVEIVFENIHQGTDKSIVMNAVSKLVLQHQTDVNILFANYLILEDIASSLNALETPLIITNIGGNAPIFFNVNEFIFSNSIGFWESANMAAQWAVEKFGPKTAHGSYFYEAGYGMYTAFCEALKQAKGEVVFNQISEFNPNPEDFSIFEQQMALENPDFLYMLYSERDAVDFLNKLSQSEMNGKYPIVTSGVLINDEILEKVSGSSKDIFNVATWDLSDDNPSNVSFIENFKNANGKQPNYFALLGYECAALVCSASSDEHWGAGGRSKVQALKNITFDGPRGTLDFQHSNNIAVSHHVYSLSEKNERYKVESLGKLNNRDGVILNLKENSNPSGWFQPYLCQ